jgi:hypothetical protein
MMCCFVSQVFAYFRTADTESPTSRGRDTDGNHRVVDRPPVICLGHDSFDRKVLAGKGALLSKIYNNGYSNPILLSKAIEFEK